jgi:opacity protein-like surface antigen
MKKLFWILMIWPVYAITPVAAQQSYASISFGASLPMGNYGSTEDLSNSGYAKTGGAIKFDGAFFPVSYIGIGGSFSFGSNYALRDSLLQDMITYIEETASSIIEIPEDAEILYGSGFWNYINLFIGPDFSLRASQRLYFDIRALAGLTFLRAPDQELRINFDNTEIYSRTSRNTLAFGFTTGAAMRYKLNSALALRLGFDYFQSRSKFEYTFDLLQGVAEDVPPIQSNFPVRTMEISAGLAYSF